MSKRGQLAQVLHRTGALKAILAFRARTPTPWLSVLTYHRIAREGEEEPFDSGVVDVTLEGFDRQVAFLKNHFNVVGVDDLCAFARGGSLPPNPVAITFDDGYLDSYEYALPILLRHRCKGIFFIATKYIEERRLYWWDRAAYVLKNTVRGRIRLRYPELEIDLRGDRDREIHRVFRVIKHRTLDISTFLDELSKASGIAWSPDLERAAVDRLLMRWDHVRALHRAGMDVQSHTRTHRVLHTLAPHELADEMVGSRLDLERELGAPVRSIAYPVGKPVGPDSAIRSALAESGYEIGFSNGTGPTPLWGPIDRFDIRRQTIERDLSDEFLLSILAVPALAPKHPWHSTPG
jgi:peptidoglycan/xylan/chitin deacetylase (PgdA/CDA1 family)